VAGIQSHIRNWGKRTQRLDGTDLIIKPRKHPYGVAPSLTPVEAPPADDKA